MNEKDMKEQRVLLAKIAILYQEAESAPSPEAAALILREVEKIKEDLVKRQEIKHN